MAESAQGNPAMQSNVADILDRYDNLLTHAQKRGQELDEVRIHRLMNMYIYVFVNHEHPDLLPLVWYLKPPTKRQS